MSDEVIKLSNDEICMVSFMSGFGVKTSVNIGGVGAEYRFSDRAQIAIDRLVASGLVSVEPFNNFGRLTYRPTEKIEPYIKLVTIDFMENHGRWAVTERVSQ